MFMNLTAALIYWVIIALWLAVLTTVCVAFVRNPRTFGTVRLLLSVIAVDTVLFRFVLWRSVRSVSGGHRRRAR